MTNLTFDSKKNYTYELACMAQYSIYIRFRIARLIWIMNHIFNDLCDTKKHAPKTCTNTVQNTCFQTTKIIITFPSTRE